MVTAETTATFNKTVNYPVNLVKICQEENVHIINVRCTLFFIRILFIRITRLKIVKKLRIS